MNIKNALQVIIAISVLILGACKNTWDEHTEILGEHSKVTLLDRIAAEPSLSKFYQYVKQSGLDSALSSSKTYTVWGPDNQAIDALNSAYPNYLTDPQSVKDFVRYHIATLLEPATNTQLRRVLTLTGLYVSVHGSQFEEASVSKADLYAKNGILHIVNTALKVKPTIYAAALERSHTSQHDDMIALDTMVNGELKRSPRWSSIVSKMAASDSLYTYFVVNNATYDAETERIKPYYKSAKTRPDSTQSYLVKIAMLENMLVKGLYELDQLPDTLLSIGGVKLPIKKSAIVSSYKTNNGIIYELNELPINLKHRIKEFKIEGEQTERRFSRTDKNGNTFYRTKLDSLGVPFSDIEIYNHGVSQFTIEYFRPEVPTATYNVYVRAVSGVAGDPQTVQFTQRFGIPTFPNATNFVGTQVLFTHVVNPRRYSEVYLGQFTVSQYGTLAWRLMSATSTGVNVNTLILDYARFVPVLPN